MKRQEVVKAVKTGGLAAAGAALIAVGIGLVDAVDTVPGVIMAVLGAVCMIAAMYLDRV